MNNKLLQETEIIFQKMQQWIEVYHYFTEIYMIYFWTTNIPK